MRVVYESADHLVTEYVAWRPAWLGHEAEEDLFVDTFAERLSRRSFEQPVDPAVLAATGFSTYNSPGQRAAVHAVLLARARSTLVVTLPTGSGKSLIAQVPALLAGEGACTVVVVPTIALALDQARQFAVLWQRRHRTSVTIPFAWHSATPDPDKQQIKRALRSGHQPILFTSPESVVGSLRIAICDAAQRGYLKYLVVDEAHLVAQWGDSFRPEFQSLAAFRRALLSAAPGNGFKTVLMTATLTADALNTIETLFTDGERAELIASVGLRTEPRYWFAQASGFEDQQDKVLEVLRHAPRPLVLYVTEVKRAIQWARLLRAHGHERVAVFHGETSSRDRQELVDAWAADELDIMVATSAFGVGIDKRDVRCVVHACVPESLDRYYQEVGRSGRDGLASTAIAVFINEDLETARGIAIPSLISADLGLPRWEQMLQHAVPVPGAASVWRLDLATVPPNLHRATDYNRAWNLRTLMLMARARVIALAAEPLALVSDREGPAPELSEEDLRALFDTVLVRILRPDHRDPHLWATHIEQSREETVGNARVGLARMERVLRAQSEISQELQSLYTITRPDGRVSVHAVCSGCPKCRASRSPNQGIAIQPLVRPLYVSDNSDLERWRHLFPALAHSPVLIVFDAGDPSLERRLDQLALQLRDCGMRDLHVRRTDWPGLANWQVMRNSDVGTFVVLTDLADPADELSQVPRLTVFRHWNPEAFTQLEQDGGRPFDWIAMPSDATDPFRPDRRLAELRECVWSSAILERLAS